MKNSEAFEQLVAGQFRFGVQLALHHTIQWYENQKENE